MVSFMSINSSKWCKSRGRVLYLLFFCLLLTMELKHISRTAVGIESFHVDYIVSEVGEKHGSTHKIHRNTQTASVSGMPQDGRKKRAVCLHFPVAEWSVRVAE